MFRVPKDPREQMAWTVQASLAFLTALIFFLMSFFEAGNARFAWSCCLEFLGGYYLVGTAWSYVSWLRSPRP